MERYGMPYEGQYGSPLTNRHDRMLSHQPAMPMPMLLPLPPVSMVMNAMFPKEIQRQRQIKRKEQNLEYYEKFIVNQNNNLRKVAKVINRQFGEVFDITAIKAKATRLKRNNLREDTPSDLSEDIPADEPKFFTQKPKGRSKNRSPSPGSPRSPRSPGSPSSPGSIEDHIADSPASPSPTQSPTKNASPLTKRLKKITKVQRPLNLWGILWALAYPTLVKKDAEAKVAERKSKVEQGSLKKTQEQKNQIMEFINKNCMPQLQDIYKLKKALVIVNEPGPKEKPVGEKDRKKNFATLVGKLNTLMSTLNGVITLQTFPKGVITFFEGITRELAVIPPKLLSEFETSRLEFTHYGTLKNLNEMRCKLLLGLFTLVRVLIYTCLVNPWVATDQVTETPILVKNLKNCSSILYHVIMDYFRDNIQPVKDNQKHVPAERRVVQTKNPLAVFGKKPGEEDVSQEVLSGLYSRDVLKDYLDSNQEVNKLKELLAECYDKLYFLVPKGRE